MLQNRIYGSKTTIEVGQDLTYDESLKSRNFNFSGNYKPPESRATNYYLSQLFKANL